MAYKLKRDTTTPIEIEVLKQNAELGNVPNVTTNNQTPSYTMASGNADLVSGETLTIAFGKIARSINSLIAHIADNIRHITSTERTNWNLSYTNNHKHSNKTILDNATASYTATDKTKLNGIESGAQVNDVTGVKGNAEATYRIGNVNITKANVGLGSVDNTADSTKAVLTATKLATARTIALSGGVTGTATNFDGSRNITVPITSIQPEYIASGYTSSQIYFDTHPEGTKTVIPFINNDLAFFYKRGGSYKVYYDGVNSGADISILFDGTPSYWMINPTGVTEIVIELTLHKTFTWNNTLYLSFGSVAWRSTNITFDVMNTNNSETEWTNKATVTGNSRNSYMLTFSHNNGTGFNKMRLRFSGWRTSIFRLAQIGIINYGSFGVSETFISRGGSSVFGTLYPSDTNTYNLGNSTHYWNNVYANTFTGTLSGNASTATSASKLTTARTISLTGAVSGSASFDGSNNVSITTTGAAASISWQGE